MLLVASSVLAQSGFDKGASAYKRGDFETALAVFRPLAEKGDAKAQSILGLMYSYGEGVPVDYREAARWYRRAAEQSSGVAQYNLGMFYLDGKGVSQNTDEAIAWLTKAADGGHFRARSELAKLGVGSYSSLASAPSASLEAPPTMTTTGSEPRSVPVDYREAARWYRRAAEQSSGVAQYNLGMFYLDGKGVSQNTDEAIAWLTKAADGGHFRARSELAKLGVGSYSSLASAPSASLEAPPTMTTTGSEPRSVVMRKPAPPAPEPYIKPRKATQRRNPFSV